MKIILFIITAALLTGCGDYQKERIILRTQVICTDETTDKRANFVLECLKNANPLSDEEPEDWILSCKDMAAEIYCVTKSVRVTQTRYCRNCYFTDSNIELISSDK